MKTPKWNSFQFKVEVKRNPVWPVNFSRLSMPMGAAGRRLRSHDELPCTLHDFKGPGELRVRPGLHARGVSESLHHRPLKVPPLQDGYRSTVISP